MTKIVIASSNLGKIEEIRSILKDLKVEIFSQKDVGLEDVDIVEDGKTLTDNALLKARGIKELVNNDYLVLADDTGLFVDYLDGQPGVHSARFAGENPTDKDNRDKMLKMLKNATEDQRGAEFRTVVALVGLDEDIIVEGSVAGKIIEEPRGTSGFGYDKLFLPSGYDQTMAEMDLETKNQISHRREALNRLKDKLESIL